MSKSLRNSFQKILGVFLIFILIGTSPGIFEAFRLDAAEKVKNSPFSVKSTKNVSVKEISDTDIVKTKTVKEKPEAEPEKKAMGRAEKLAWTIGKALLPTLAVMGFCAAMALPLTWVVVGSIVIGATVAGVTTFAYENRMNQFRDKGKKKSKDKILRDVSIAAAIEGAMAPFTMLTAGFVKAIGPTTIKAVAATAAKVGLAQFTGNTVSNIAKGTVTNLWYDHYYNFDEEEKQLEAELELLSNKSNATAEEQVRFAEIMQRLDTIKKEKYTIAKFINDEKKAAVSSVITGFLGGGASKIAANTPWAKVAANKIFGSPKNAGMLANAVVSNPFAFVSGSANAAMAKNDIALEIYRSKKLQKKYAPDSPAWGYYENKINGLKQTRDKIDLIKAGTTSMINNLAVQSAAMTVAVAKARLWEMPQARRKAIEDKYRSNDPLWQKANRVKTRMDTYKAKAPQREDFKTRTEFIKAVLSHKKQVYKFERVYKAAKVRAVDGEKTPENRAISSQITTEIDTGIKLKQRLELAKSLGDEAYIKFKMDEIKKKSTADGTSFTSEELRQKAINEFKSEYATAAEKSAQKIADMENKLGLQDDSTTVKGTVITGDDGKRYVILKDADGVERYRREVSQPKDSWYNKFLNTDPAKLEARDLRLAYKIANAGGAMVKPSIYRATYVDMQINKLKAQGMSSQQINTQMDSIVSEANTSMINNFGGSWQTVVQSELISAGLSKAKYQNGEPPDFEDIYNTVHNTGQSKIISEFQKELNKQAKDYTLIPIKNQLKDKEIGSFAEKYVNTVLDKTYNETIKKTANNTIKDIYTNTENKVADIAEDVVEEVSHDYEEEHIDKDESEVENSSEPSVSE